MNLYLLTGTARGYDTFDSCVVIAESEEVAKNVFPNGQEDGWKYSRGQWAESPADVDCVLLGKAVKGLPSGQVICASFNAG
jgi:hypothetical protein